MLNTRTNRKGTYYGANGTVCKYHENPKGYSENCKYAKVNKAYTTRTVYAPMYKPAKYEAAKIKAVKYEAAKVHKAPKGNMYGVTKGHEGKDLLKGHKGPKH